jgi:hypothetical protein
VTEVTGEVMVRDIYPAEVYEVGGKIHTKVRVFLTNRRMIVWGTDRGGRVPEKRLDVELSDPIGAFAASAVALPRSAPIEVATLTQGFIVNKISGCRCGSALLALSPPAPWEKGQS